MRPIHLSLLAAAALAACAQPGPPPPPPIVSFRDNLPANPGDAAGYQDTGGLAIGNTPRPANVPLRPARPALR